MYSIKEVYSTNMTVGIKTYIAINTKYKYYSTIQFHPLALYSYILFSYLTDLSLLISLNKHE